MDFHSDIYNLFEACCCMIKLKMCTNLLRNVWDSNNFSFLSFIQHLDISLEPTKHDVSHVLYKKLHLRDEHGNTEQYRTQDTFDIIEGRYEITEITSCRMCVDCRRFVDKDRNRREIKCHLNANKSINQFGPNGKFIRFHSPSALFRRVHIFFMSTSN